MQNSEWKTCVSFLADQSTTPSIARHSQTGILLWIPVVLKRNGTPVTCSEFVKLGAWKETAEFAN
jgi:hypothetical protein